MTVVVDLEQGRTCTANTGEEAPQGWAARVRHACISGRFRTNHTASFMLTTCSAVLTALLSQLFLCHEPHRLDLVDTKSACVCSICNPSLTSCVVYGVCSNSRTTISGGCRSSRRCGWVRRCAIDALFFLSMSLFGLRIFPEREDTLQRARNAYVDSLLKICDQGSLHLIPTDPYIYAFKRPFYSEGCLLHLSMTSLRTAPPSSREAYRPTLGLGLRRHVLVLSSLPTNLLTCC